MRHGNEGDYLETGLHYRGLFFLGPAPCEFSILSAENQSEVFFGTKGAVFKFGRGKGKVRGDGVLSSSLEKRVFQWTHLHGDDSTRESLCLSFTAASRFLDPRRNGLPKYQSLQRPSTKLYGS